MPDVEPPFTARPSPKGAPASTTWSPMPPSQLCQAAITFALASLGVFGLLYILGGNQVESMVSFSYNFMFTRSSFDFAAGVTASMILFFTGIIVALLFVLWMRVAQR